MFHSLIRILYIGTITHNRRHCHMTFKQVEYFLRVCTCRNIAAAAEELFVSRPVISKAILTLEEEV